MVEEKKYSYPGVVKSISEAGAVIQWDIEGYSLDQTYTQKFFKNGIFPRVGTKFTLHAAVKEVSEKRPLAHEFIEEVSSGDSK